NEREETPDILPKLRLVGEAEVPPPHPQDEGVDLLLVHRPRIGAEAQLEHDLEEVQELGLSLPKGGGPDCRLDAVQVSAHRDDERVSLHLLRYLINFSGMNLSVPNVKVLGRHCPGREASEAAESSFRRQGVR